MKSTVFTARAFAFVLLAGAFGIAQSTAFTQSSATTLETALKTSLERGADIATSVQSLLSARADLQVKQSDPTTLVVSLTQAQQSVALETARLSAKRIEVMGNVTTAYMNLYEAQENLKVLNAQVALDTRNLEVARAKLSQKNGTELDVRKAESTLSTSKQNLANQKAQLPTLSNKLEVLLGAELKGDITVADPPAYKEVKVDSAALEKSLETRLPTMVQAMQGVELQTLNVKLADNDYTPANTLADAKANLLTAQRTLDTTRKNAVTSLRDAVRSVNSALETVRLNATSLQNERDGLKQDGQRFKNGTITRVQLQQSELSVLQAEYKLTQSQNTYFKALTSLSSAAGVDVTGMLEKIGGGAAS
jgi:outer membrane protein